MIVDVTYKVKVNGKDLSAKYVVLAPSPIFLHNLMLIARSKHERQGSVSYI